jgi:AraC family transcriptional regulator of adaptative response/methylated-DNA-[protein]-cysteine methyltransferase
MLNQENCWKAVLANDAAQDGRFYFGVLTTGAYCRPSCPARTPLRKNVRFYETPEAAERDGLRPCRRCRPSEAPIASPAVMRIQQLCEYIRLHIDDGSAMSLDRLSRQAHLSPSYLQRTFRSIVGVSPKEFVDACRIEKFKCQLREGGSVTNAIYDAGFGSSSRVYERIDSRLGMTPSAYRAGGERVAISCVCIETPLGLMMIAATDRGLCSLQFGDSHRQLLANLQSEFPAAAINDVPQPHSEQLQLWIEDLSRRLQGERPRMDIPVDVRATAFQAKVWRYLQSIPSGDTRTYSEVARSLGTPRAARAVGNACALNRVAIVIPCHRVIRGDGNLGGYRWGLERKQQLLLLESRPDARVFKSMRNRP